MMFGGGFGGSQPVIILDQGQPTNGYRGAPSGQEYHHYYGANGEEVSRPEAAFSGRMSAYHPSYSSPQFPHSYTVTGMMERGRVIGLDPEVSTPGVSHLPTHILMELERVYGHLGNARFSVSCSDGRFSIQTEVLSPPMPPPPPPRRPGLYFDEDDRRGPRGNGGRRGRRRDSRRDSMLTDGNGEVDEDGEIVIDIPMETYRKLLEQKRRHGRKPDIIIDTSPNVYEGHSMDRRTPNYDQPPNFGGHNQNNNATPRSTHTAPAFRPGNAGNRNNYDPQAYYEPEDQGQLVQQYRKQQHGKRGGKDDGDNYEPQAMQTERSRAGQGRHSAGAGTDMGAPPDSYIMDKYLDTYMKK